MLIITLSGAGLKIKRENVHFVDAEYIEFQEANLEDWKINGIVKTDEEEFVFVEVRRDRQILLQNVTAKEFVSKLKEKF